MESMWLNRDQFALASTRALKKANSMPRRMSVTEALEQQTATSEILGVIASSRRNSEAVLDAVAENAARLCEASDVSIWRH